LHSGLVLKHLFDLIKLGFAGVYLLFLGFLKLREQYQSKGIQVEDVSFEFKDLPIHFGLISETDHRLLLLDFFVGGVNHCDDKVKHHDKVEETLGIPGTPNHIDVQVLAEALFLTVDLRVLRKT
jgi:hypothetical protein